MTAFAAAVDALFADPNLAREAVYEPADGDPFPVRVIARRADAITEFGVDGAASYRPTNADIKEHGPVLAMDALRYSLNIPSVQMQYLVGSPTTAEFAEKLGDDVRAGSVRYGRGVRRRGGRPGAGPSLASGPHTDHPPEEAP